MHGSCGTTVEPGYLPAAAAIDWAMPGTRIGDRTRPLADKTRRRIAAGMARYWTPLTVEAAGNTYDAADPKHPSHGQANAYYRAWSTHDVLKALHTTASKALCVPAGGTWNDDARPVTDPHRTMTTRDTTALVMRNNGIRGGHPARHVTPASEYLRTLTANGPLPSIIEPPFIAELRGGGSSARPVTDPAATFTASGNHHGLVTPFVMTNQHNNRPRSVAEAMATLVTGNTQALVAPYYGSGSGETSKPVSEPIGTLTTVDRYALIHRNNSGGAEMTTPVSEYLRTLTTAGHQSVITPGDIEAATAQVDDCLFRMLQPHEVAAGMAFPADYLWEGTRAQRVKLAGNAVTPPAARDLIAAVVEALS